MMLWVEPFMWGLCRAIAFAFQLVGFTGLMVSAFVALIILTEKLCEEGK